MALTQVTTIGFESRFYSREKLFCAALEHIVLLTEYRERWILKSYYLFLKIYQVFHYLSSTCWIEPSFSQSQDAVILVGIYSMLIAGHRREESDSAVLKFVSGPPTGPWSDC
jgi:hypothetical protein